uniref:NADH-ubiquinone oxidoreductase chain 4L n=1 Tax=Mycopsylla fici TaxID=1681222 RepID=A0A343UQS4_9HEMI|nr:NADH dehydrogenase subunit 4L [Mycopsylla fici]AVF97049.1 NADH dehydrogenase subunit 4L [Mycopsylla fici]
MMITLSCFMMLYFGLKMLYMNKDHILMVLMVLEFLSLVILLLFVNLLFIYLFDMMITVYFLVVMVCEAVLGLVLLTLLIRSHGSDYMKSMILLLC